MPPGTRGPRRRRSEPCSDLAPSRAPTWLRAGLRPGSEPCSDPAPSRAPTWLRAVLRPSSEPRSDPAPSRAPTQLRAVLRPGSEPVLRPGSEPCSDLAPSRAPTQLRAGLRPRERTLSIDSQPAFARCAAWPSTGNADRGERTGCYELQVRAPDWARPFAPFGGNRHVQCPDGETSVQASVGQGVPVRPMSATGRLTPGGSGFPDSARESAA